MTTFRVALVGLWLVLASYTAVIIARHGIGLLPIFFGDIGDVAWPGQFNLDFLCFWLSLQFGPLGDLAFLPVGL